MISENNNRTNHRRILLEERLNEVREKLENPRTQYTIKRLFAFLIFGAVYSFFISLGAGEDLNSILHDKGLLILFISLTLVFGLTFFFLFPFGMKTVLKMQEKAIMAELAILGSEILQENIQEDFFTNLVKINFKYIDKYYLQTQIQADKSFTISVVAAIVAFVIIVSGIVLMFFDKVNSSYIATGTGVISEFIAAVFFYLYNQTIVKMGEYHHKLVLTQNISLALKITEQMKDEEKSKAQTYLIEQLTKDINQYLASRPEK